MDESLYLTGSQCIITLDNEKLHCTKCTTPNKRNGKWYCPQHRVYLDTERQIYGRVFRNIIKED